MRNEVYNCDCIEYMRTLPDHYFDIAVCDPPYGSANAEELVGGRATTYIMAYLHERQRSIKQSIANPKTSASKRAKRQFELEMVEESISAVENAKIKTP